MRTIKLVDLYCCAGGCSVGYFRAATEMGYKIEITGVDLEPQPNYPFDFVQADAIDFLKCNSGLFTHFHASPPCQKSSRTKSLHNGRHLYKHHLLIEPTRIELIKTGRPFIMENVVGADLINPIILDGPMFGLRVIRKRLFESNVRLIPAPKGTKLGTVGGKNFTRKRPGYYFIVGGHQTGTLAEWQNAMQIDWMKTKAELAQAIPPAYTQYLGKQFFAQ